MERTPREWVEEYIDNLLTPEDRQLFEEQLQTDETFTTELNLQLDAIAALRASEKVKLKQEINTWWAQIGEPISIAQETNASNKIVPLASKKYLYLAAAMILISLSIGYLYFVTNTHTPSTETLVAQYLSEPATISSDSRTATSSTDSLRTVAQKHYNSKEFAESIHLFTQLVNTPNPTFLDHLYLGLSHLYLPNQTDFSPAIAHLQQVLETDNDFHQKASWFLALAYYKNGNTLESKKILKEISNEPEGDYAKKAGELLQKLNDMTP
ncbi:MAG: hypothetical protein R3E32_12740 [Chitinophagales bacterium]